MAVLRFFEQFYPILFVWLSAALAAFTLSKKISFAYRLFCWLIIFLSLMETVGNIMAFYGQRNHFLFNILEPINFFGVSYFFYLVLNNTSIKKITCIYLFIFPIFRGYCRHSSRWAVRHQRSVLKNRQHKIIINIIA